MEGHNLAALGDIDIELARYEYRKVDPITKVATLEKIKNGEPTHAV